MFPIRYGLRMFRYTELPLFISQEHVDVRQDFRADGVVGHVVDFERLYVDGSVDGVFHAVYCYVPEHYVSDWQALVATELINCVGGIDFDVGEIDVVDACQRVFICWYEVAPLIEHIGVDLCHTKCSLGADAVHVDMFHEGSAAMVGLHEEESMHLS